MALNVQWRWSMPQVGNPDAVAQGNRDAFNAGLDAIVSGLQKHGENQRADAKQKWLEDTTAEKFAHQVEQDKLAQLNANRNYMLQRDQFNQNKAVQDFNMQRQKVQDEWRQKFYDTYFGNDPAELEYQKLLAELKGQQEDQQDQRAQMVMLGLNPQLMR